MVSKEQILALRQQHLFPNQIPYYREPIQLVKAKGTCVWDEAGKEYLDAIGGIVCISVGHNHPKIKEKLLELLSKDAIQHTTYLYLSQYLAELAAKLASVAPAGLSKCYLTNSGSEANEVAILTAREATGRQMIVALRHCYHGGTSMPLALCGSSPWKFLHSPQASVVHAMAPYCYRCPFGKTPQSCQLECADDVKQVIETTTSGNIAAFIAEPVMGVAGYVDPPLAYHKKVYEIIKQYGGLYISDEVQTGMGRTGSHFFAIEQSGVIPDLITLAKGLGSGAPIGAVIAKPELADALKNKKHFNTFGGDPFQAAQANEVINIIINENLIQNAKTEGDYLKTAFKGLQKDFPLIGDVRGRGLIIGIELVKDRQTKEPASQETALLMEIAKDNGLLIGRGGYHNNVLRIAPSMGISRQESELLVAKLTTAFSSVSRPT